MTIASCPITSDVERRGVPAEFRADADDHLLVGYAAVTGVETVIGDWWREVIAPGAFRSALDRQDDTRALLNHNPDIVLGRTAAGTLDLVEDDSGLLATIRLDPGNSQHGAVRSGVLRGDLSQMSFGFRAAAGGETVEEERGKLPLRTITDLELFDVSVVTYPAYPSTTVEARDRFATLIGAKDGAAAIAARARRLELVARRGLT